MKILKIILLSILSVFVTIYLAFLFVLPYSIDLNQYAPQITKLIQDNTGFQAEIEGLKVTTAWNLSAGATINKTDLKDSKGKKFAQINGLQVRLSLIPLFFRTIKIDKISADKILANIDINNQKPNFQLTAHSSQLTFSTNMPSIFAKKYRISLIDGQNTYSVKGSDLKISDFVLDKKIKIKTSGDLVLNNRKQISYNIAVFSKVFPKGKNQEADIINIFQDLCKYNVKGNINADVKIKQGSNDIDIDGKININKLSFTLSGKTLPQSSLSLDFTGDKAKISSIFYSDLESKIHVSGWFRNGKHKYVDLQVASDKINIENLLKIAKPMSKTFGIKKLQDIDATGFLKANFAIKSDFKKVESSGYLKIKDAKITNKLYNVSLSSVNADVDFSQDAIRIKQAKANLNGQPITISGIIDKKANADISVLANNLQLKGVLLTLGKSKILSENDVLGGLVGVNISLKGRLNKALPKVKVLVSNVNLKNKQTKTQIKCSKVVIDTNCDKKNKGKAEITGLKVFPSTPATISAPKIDLNFDEKDMNVEKTYLYINNIKTTLSGKISDINSNPRLNLITISVPNQISVPIKGYAGSNVVIKGNLTLKGDLNKPQIQGLFTIPLIRIPSTSTVLKNTTLSLDKTINISCPQVQIADSSMSFSAQINNDFSNGIVAQGVKFNSNNIDLNTLAPVLQNLSRNSNFSSNSKSGLTILNGKGIADKFKVGSIVASGVNSDIALKNNILYLNNLRGDAYLGKLGGNINYDFAHNRVNLRLQGRGLSANPALTALIERNDDIHGQLDFDSNLSMITISQDAMLRSLKGSTHFIISNGKMGVLGKFEHLLYAQNIISNSVFKATINVIAKAITVKNTGVYKYMKGKITFSDGIANIVSIKTSGPSMSLYITGRYYLLDGSANLIMLGRISDDVVRILGPIGEFSMDKAISSIPKLGEITAFFANQFTTNPNYENTSQIPYLTPRTEFKTKEFKVIIDGDVQKQSSVKSFKWLSRPKIGQSIVSQQYSQTTNNQPDGPKKQPPAVPDFVKRLPDFKN